MAANTTPIFLKAVNEQWISGVVTANTSFDMSTGTSYLIFTADATNGSKIEDVYINHQGTNIASVVRFFVNNGSSTGTPANQVLVHEETVAANTASQVAASVPVVWRAGLVLKPGFKLYCTTGTTVASGYHVAAVGGDF